MDRWIDRWMPGARPRGAADWCALAFLVGLCLTGIVGVLARIRL